ncbi:unnamed protein product [Rhizoctonia solani]|uniref:Amidohydrolase-related domain-containing protein n=1 Tax=Rhizoctonia solani TaxID=456999 RepID=A0A8H3B092_9AGAM|nr:unnamed protein product [Rhizoctonia solani]
MIPHRLFYGAIITPVSVRKAEFWRDALLYVNSEGIIGWIEHKVKPSDIEGVANKHGLKIDKLVEVYKLRHGEWIMPGLIDTHTHAPQFPNLGIGGQDELLKWLEETTYPTEKLFEDTEFAECVYSSVVDRVLSSGTTTCCYFGSIHLEATKILAKIVHDKGQRAFVGKCNMDTNEVVPWYKDESAEKSIEDTLALIYFIRKVLCSPLVHPILAPRYAISSSSDLLKGLGDLASKDDTLAIETHISENVTEVEVTLKAFPEASSYADVYKCAGLLTGRTILAHAVGLGTDCAGGVGLGTDCSGGFSPSILTAVRDAGFASKVIGMTAVGSLPSPYAESPYADSDKLADKTLPLSALLHLSTLGGAQLCNLEQMVGSIEVGKEFDALWVNVRPDAGNPGIWANLEKEVKSGEGEEKGMPPDTLEALLEKFFFCGDDRNVRKVWVKGQLVSGADK